MAAHPSVMLTDLYIEALLVDEELANQVWEAWDAGGLRIPRLLCYGCIFACHTRYRQQVS